MIAVDNTAFVREFMERAFNQGDLSAIDELLAPDSVDHQEPPGTNFPIHIKGMITGLRTAFPDLHFEIHDIISQGDRAAFRSTMTGTHLGVATFGPRPIPPTGHKVSVAHMHFIRVANGQGQEQWHLWDLAAILSQLGVAPAPISAAPQQQSPVFDRI